MSKTEANTVQRARRLAARHGEQLVKVRESSRYYPQYGPYYVTDPSTNALVAGGLEIDDVFKRYT